MNGYTLLRLLQKKMNDPSFQSVFNKLSEDLDSVPGLQKEIMRIVAIKDESSRQKAIDSLPKDAKKIVNNLIEILNK